MGAVSFGGLLLRRDGRFFCFRRSLFRLFPGGRGLSRLPRPGLIPMGAVSFGVLGFRIIRFLFRLPLWRDVLLFRRGSAFLDAVVGFRRLDQFPHFLNLIFRQVLFPAVLFTYL